MERKRKEYLKTGKTKKPTEILIFTDGLSFSCTSMFTKSLQVMGGAITVGYHSRPDLVESKYDASQSNSAVDYFLYTEQIQNLQKLGFKTSITFTESFDPNDKKDPKVPMEFKIYPVDEVSNIYTNYYDDILYRFIKEADSIFKKYNNLEDGKCNPDNHFLYYETKDCDSKNNIKNAHGGYLCGSDGKWDKNKCIVGYCDDGYILNDERTQCIKDPCEKIILNEVSITEIGEIKYIIKPNNIYIFKIENEHFSYSFNSNIDNLLYVYNFDHILTAVNKKALFNKNNKIYCNYFVNITEDATINIISQKKESHIIPKNEKGFSTGIILLAIIIGSIIVVIIIVIIILHIIKKR
jgi:hypothetical protein